MRKNAKFRLGECHVLIFGFFCFVAIGECHVLIFGFFCFVAIVDYSGGYESETMSSLS